MAFTPKDVTEYVKHAKTCFPATKAFDALDFASTPPAKIKHLHEAAGLEMAFIAAEKFHELFRDKSRWGESAVGAYMRA